MLDVIFEIWEPSYLLYLSGCMSVIIIILLLFFWPVLSDIHWRRKKYRMDVDNGIKNEWLVREQGLQLAKDVYRKVTIFDDVTFCVPFAIIHMILIISAYITREESIENFACVLLLTPLFLVVYFYVGSKVKAYNKDISLRIMVKGKIVGDVIWHPQRYRTPAVVEVQYEYVDPVGVVHTSWQKVPVTFGLYSEQNWKWLYFDGKEVDVLLLLSNYKDSYLPMYENYSKKYMRKYVVYLESQL